MGKKGKMMMYHLSATTDANPFSATACPALKNGCSKSKPYVVPEKLFFFVLILTVLNAGINAKEQ